MKLALFILFDFLVMVGAAPPRAPKYVEEKMVKKTEQTLTVEALDGYIGILKMFKDMLPLDIVNTLDNLNVTQKGEIVSFFSNWFQDRIQKPNTTTQILEVLRDHLPSVHDKIQSLNETFYTKFGKLKPETQNLLREWRDKAVDLVSDERPAGETAGQNLQLIRDFALSIRDVKQEIRDDLKTQFPQAVSLTEGLGFTVFTTMIMIVQKIVETAATVNIQERLDVYNPTALALGCNIPLD